LVEAASESGQRVGSRARIFSARHVLLATAIGGPLGGGLPLAVNELRLGRSRAGAFAVLAASVVLTYTALVARWATDALWWVPLYVLTVLGVWIAAMVLLGSPIKAHAVAGGEFVSWPAALALGVVGWAATIAGAVIVVLFMALVPSVGARLWYEWRLLRPQKLLGSCDIPAGSPRLGVAEDQHACLEFTSDRSWGGPADAEAARALCHDAWSERACDRAGVVGGCRPSAGRTFWYYRSSTIHSASDMVQTCEDELEVVRP
jgi:hypothetical protein